MKFKGFALTSSVRAAWDSGAFNIVAGAFACSFVSLLVKVIGGTVPTCEIILSSSLACWIITTGVIVSGSRSALPWRLEHGLAGLCALRGILAAATIFTFYTAVDVLPLEDAVTTFFCTPAFVALLESCLFCSRMRLGTAVGSVLCVLGVVYVGQPGFLDQLFPSTRGGDMPPVPLAGYLVGLLSALLNALSFLVASCIGKRVPAMGVAWWQHTIVSVSCCALLVLKIPSGAIQPSSKQALLLMANAVANFFGMLHLIRGLQLQSASMGSSLNSLQVVFSYIWEVVILRGPVQINAVLGSGLILAGVLSVSAGHKRKPCAPCQEQGTYGAEPTSAGLRQPLLPAGFDRDYGDGEQHSPQQGMGQTLAAIDELESAWQKGLKAQGRPAYELLATSVQQEA